MNLTDPLSARKALTPLLPDPSEWPEDFIWNWDLPNARHFDGYTIGCARVLAEHTGIIENTHTARKDLDLTCEESDNIFMHVEEDDSLTCSPSVVADRLEEITS